MVVMVFVHQMPHRSYYESKNYLCNTTFVFYQKPSCVVTEVIRQYGLPIDTSYLFRKLNPKFGTESSVSICNEKSIKNSPWFYFVFFG